MKFTATVFAIVFAAAAYVRLPPPAMRFWPDVAIAAVFAIIALAWRTPKQ